MSLCRKSTSYGIFYWLSEIVEYPKVRVELLNMIKVELIDKSILVNMEKDLPLVIPRRVIKMRFC